MHNTQIIQEMELILKREEHSAPTLQVGMAKGVPAIIKFAESYTKKSSSAVDVRDYGMNNHMY